MPRITVTSRETVTLPGGTSGNVLRTWKNEHGRGEPKVRAEGQFLIVTDEYGAETWIPFDLVLRVEVSEPHRSF